MRRAKSLQEAAVDQRAGLVHLVQVAVRPAQFRVPAVDERFHQQLQVVRVP